MNRILAAALMLITVASRVPAQEIDMASLGSLELGFAQAIAVDSYPGQQVAAEVAFRKGEAFTLSAPGRIQQINYLVDDGDSVVKGQHFAVLRGPEIHHFQMAYLASTELLAASKQRFNSNRALYARKAIPASQWIDASEHYYTALLEYEHMRHFFELVAGQAGDDDTLTLAAPLGGILDYDAGRSMIETDEAIAAFIPHRIIRLKAELPGHLHDQVAWLQAGDCRLSIERVDAVMRDFFLTAWSEPLTSACNFMLGKQLLATPLLRANAYQVPADAVFQWQRSTHVLVGIGQSLSPVAVSILAASGENYILQSASDLAGRDILVTSVSAVQGILLGMGGE